MLFNIYMNELDQFIKKLTLQVAEKNKRKCNKHYFLLQYVRYAGKLLIGIVGSKKLTTYVQKQINDFIENDLYLEIKENKILGRDKNCIQFLGFNISFIKLSEKSRIKLYGSKDLNKYSKKILT